MRNIGILDWFKRDEGKAYPYVDGQKEEIAALAGWFKDVDFRSYVPKGYRTLATSPEIKTGVEKIAEIISAMSIHQMKNTDKGDIRVKDGLSKFIDIEPSVLMNRQLLISWVVQEIMLYGNAVVIPKTRNGLLYDLEPIDYREYQIVTDDWKNKNNKNNKSYYIHVNKDNKIYRADEILHFRYNPSLEKPWEGQGQEVLLRDLMDGLGQARSTVHDFLENQLLPTVIIKVAALPGDLKSSEGRDSIERRFVNRAKNGQPWIVPDMMDVEQIQPLTLNDIGINERIKIDKESVASILGIPAFLLGVGVFNKAEYNNFIRSKIKVICMAIEQELTRKLLVAPDRYFTFNSKSMLSYDLDTVTEVYTNLYEHGIVTGNEVRDAIGMSPLDGLDELLILENYIPVNKSGSQKKLENEKLKGGDEGE